MNSGKKENKKTGYVNDSHNSEGTIHEPMIAYSINTSTYPNKTIGMMGLAGKKEFEAIKNDNDFISVIRTGIPKQAMTHLMTVADLTLLEMASIIHTSDRTLRRYKPQQKLSQEQSERMIELARLYSKGEEVFYTLDAFRQWMDTILQPLGNKKPKEYLDTSIGINMLMDELGRIQHGVFA